MVAIAGKEVPTPDAVLIGTSAVALIGLFLPWYGISKGGISVNGNAFDSGFFAWFPAVILIAVGGLVAARIFAGFSVPAVPKVGPALLFLGLSALGTVLLLLKFVIDYNLASGAGLGDDFKVTPKFGFYITILLGLAQSFFNFQQFKASGEDIPEIGGRNFNPGGGTPPPPPPV